MTVRELIAELVKLDLEAAIYDFDYRLDEWFPVEPGWRPVTDAHRCDFSGDARPSGPWCGI